MTKWYFILVFGVVLTTLTCKDDTTDEVWICQEMQGDEVSFTGYVYTQPAYEPLPRVVISWNVNLLCNNARDWSEWFDQLSGTTFTDEAGSYTISYPRNSQWYELWVDVGWKGKYYRRVYTCTEPALFQCRYPPDTMFVVLNESAVKAD